MLNVLFILFGTDGVLWDVRSGKEIHKFDKLNQAISGVFHPNGLEVNVSVRINVGPYNRVVTNCCHHFSFRLFRTPKYGI